MMSFLKKLSDTMAAWARRARVWGRLALGAHPWATASGLMLLAAMILAAYSRMAHAQGHDALADPPAGTTLAYRCAQDGTLILRLVAPQKGTYYARLNAKQCILESFPQT